MSLLCFKAFLVICAFVVTFALEKFVSPNLSCGSTCSGDLGAPYDNLLIALINTQTEEDVTIYLLNDPSAPHYILSKEYAQGSSSTFLYQLPVSSTLALKKRIIQPLFCGEGPLLSNPSLASQCITRDQKLTIYVKTTEFTLNILQSMEISHIVFDASEDISVWNTDSDELRNCIYRRQRCCADPSTPSSTSIQCVISGDYSGLGLTPTTSFISLKSTDLSSTVSFISNNTDFNWFLSPNLVSLINTGSNPFSLELDNGTINVTYFSKGFIIHDQNSATSTLSSISLTNMNFENYNPFDLKLALNSRTEGFLFFAGSYYYGDLAIQNSQFVNITNSVRNGCSSLTNQYYNIPLDNTFVGVQVSKTDLWNLFHADHRGVQNSSSLIFLTTFDGTLSITSSNFSNILGTSGSVLRVDDVTQPNTSFTIADSIFDNNFAYDGFSNIRISKKSNGAFNKMLSCPRVEVVGSKFTNSYGCPGSYGNVLYLCYWDSAPPTSGTLSSYAGAASLSTYWENNTQPEDAYVTVKNCIFYYNLMSVSNSLAVIGSPFSILEGNAFQMNGGTTAQIYLFRISSSYYYRRYPSTGDPNAPLVHFGQATAVYIDRFIRLQSNSNQYMSNWGPWEGSLALGDSLTVKNWIRLADTLNFDLDSFLAHQGIPSDISQFIPDLCLRENCFMAPIITFSYDDKGTQSVYTQLTGSSLTSDVKIIMDGVTFSDNIAMYYSQYYTYNLANLQTLVQGSTANLQRFSSGFIKLLTTVESQDISLATVIPNERRNKVGFVLRNANIVNNKLLSSGCLFPTQWAEAYFVVDTQIIGNIINPNAEAFRVIAQDRPDLTTVEQNKHGLFCIYTLDSLLQWPYVLFTMNKITAKNNNGILVNQAASNAAVNMISESHFENNTCLAAGMITAFTANFVFSINNTFINNFNALGNIFIHKDTGSSSFFHSYLNNSGIHASIMYIAQSLTSIKTEVYTRAYWNDINPPILILQGGNMAQGAPYFFDGAYAVLIKCDFRQNKAYSGLLNAIQGTIAFYNSNVSDHAIAGVSVIGTLMSMSNIFMTYCQVINNSISSRPDAFVTNLGILVLYTTRFGAAYSDFINGTVDNGGVLFFGNTANAIILFSSIQNYIKLDNVHNYLIWLTFTYTTIQGLTFSNTTNLFNLVNSNVTISGLAIQNLQASFGTQFIAQSFESTIMMFGVAFNGDGQTESSTALFEGEKNYFVLIYSTFIDGTTNVINMKSSTFFSLTGTQFIFNQYPNQVTVASLSFSANAVITSCLFQGAATVLQADNTQSQLTFVNNIILTNSVSQNILISTPKGVIFEQNYIINNGITTPLEVPQSQVQIVDSLDVVYLSQNHFQSLLASINPVIIQCQKYPYNISANDNTFIANKASYGGAFELSAQKGWTGSITPQAIIQNSVFLANKAAYDPTNGQGSGRAGAIYLKSIGSTLQDTLLENSVFVGNHAEGVGGAIYFEYSPPSIDDKCIFMENYGDSLNHITGYPTRLSLYDGSMPSVVYIPNQSRRSLSSTTQNIWEGIGSGVTNQGPYSFALLDMYGQIVSDDNSSELQIWPDGYSSSNRSNFAPKLSAIANKGIYSFEDFVFNYKVNEQINVNFISSAIQNDPNNPYTNVNGSISVQVSFRECKIGEYTLKSEDSTKCIECQPGYWYLGGGGEFNNSCVECEQQSTFCLGGSNVGPRPGYWRLNDMATIVKQCPNQGACLGNEADSTKTLDPQGKCKEGFTGNLCNNCQDGWAKKSPTSNCVNCHTNVAQYLQLAGLILLQVAFLAYNVKKTMEIATQYFVNKGGLELKNNAAILLRILTNYMQIVALVGDIPVTWPTVVKDTMSVSSKASSANGQAFSIDCFYLILKASSGIRLVFLKVLVVTATPLIYIILGGLFWVIYFKIKKRIVMGNKDLLNKIITTIVIICFNLQPSVVKSCFELFQCTNLYRNDSPILFLTSDYDVQCWESEHFRWAIGLGLPCLLLWGIGLPLGMFAILRRNFKKLETPEIVKKYVFLYLGYKNDRFYWEFVIMFRKLSLICVSVFAGFHSIDLQIYMVVIIILWAHVLQRTGHPYNDDNLNHLELVALLSAGVVDFCGLYFQIIGDVEGLNTIMIIAGLAGNLYFILHFVWLYFTYQVEQIKQNEKAMKIINMIGDKLCCCFKTKSAKQAMTKIKTIVHKSKTSLTRSLRSIVIDEELNPLTTITLADTKGPSSNELHISANENVKTEDNQLRTAPKPQYSPKTSRINVDEKDIIKEDTVRENNDEESIMDSQVKGEQKLETVNMQSIVVSLNKAEEGNGKSRVESVNEKLVVNLDPKIEEVNGESRLESVDEKSIVLTLDEILEGKGSN